MRLEPISCEIGEPRAEGLETLAGQRGMANTRCDFPGEIAALSFNNEPHGRRSANLSLT